MPIQSIQEKFTHELGDIYDAEQQFLKGMQQMQQQATEPQLQQMLQQHITETEQQVKNLEQVFGQLGQQPQTEPCQAARGLLAEAQKTMKEAGTNEIRDCLIAGAAAKNEHYEIASYRGLLVGAKQMGQQQIVQLLQQNLQQEEQTAQKIEQSAPQLLQKAMQAEKGA